MHTTHLTRLCDPKVDGPMHDGTHLRVCPIHEDERRLTGPHWQGGNDHHLLRTMELTGSNNGLIPN
jgi:hypothetical protein